jgi:hypothetical protein
MYKHKVTYRHKTNTGMSGSKNLEFELEKELFHDGAGEWKKICANIISSKTGINSSDIDINGGGGIFTMQCLGKIKSNENSTNSSRNEISQEEKDALYKSAASANKERYEERERKAIREERQRLREIEEDKATAKKEARERAERRQRANELRSQGKNFQAFLVEFQNGLIGVSVVLGLAIFFFFFFKYNETTKAANMKLNSELELIEDSVKIYINEKNYDQALVLANKLVHNSHEDMEHLEFDNWNGYPKFDEYWTKKREEYKNIILNKGALEMEQPSVKKSNVEKAKKQEVLETPIEQENTTNSEGDIENNQEALDEEYQN